MSLDKFLTKDEVKAIRAEVRKKKNKSPKEWFLIELGLNTGLRVAEIAGLKCSDIVLRNELSHVAVRDGKGHRPREVIISRDFQEEAKEYLDIKQLNGEKIGPDDILLYSPKSEGAYSTRGLQLAFKRAAKKAKISPEHSIHHLRHTYASMLYKSSGHNLRLVQKQLGHKRITTTQVYADVFEKDATTAVDNLFK